MSDGLLTLGRTVPLWYAYGGTVYARSKCVKFNYKISEMFAHDVSV